MMSTQIFGLAVLICIPLIGIMCILHMACNKIHDVLEGVVLLMKYILDKEHYNDGNDIFRGKDN